MKSFSRFQTNQVNLPLQTLTGPTHHPMYPNMSVSGNGGLIQSPILMGSLLRQSGMGLDRFTQPVVGSMHSPPPNVANGLLAPQQLTACFTTEDGHGNPVAVPGSPVYACFHDQSTPGYYGTTIGGVTRAIRLPGNVEFGLPVGLNNLGMGARSVEICSEDTEASSGRQSKLFTCTVNMNVWTLINQVDFTSNASPIRGTHEQRSLH